MSYRLGNLAKIFYGTIKIFYKKINIIKYMKDSSRWMNI